MIKAHSPSHGEPYLSVVIPTYNEELRISRTIGEVITYLQAQSYPWEIVVADDGSADATVQMVAKAAAGDARVRVLTLAHRGKGWALRNGMLSARGMFRLLCDADLSVPIAQVERLLPGRNSHSPAAGQGPAVSVADIAVGSREAPGAARYGEPFLRHLMGRVFNTAVRYLGFSDLADTQCGFKCFRAEAAMQLFSHMASEGFSFDVEALYLARRAGLEVVEVGVDWHYANMSKVRPLYDTFSMTLDLLRIRWQHRGCLKMHSRDLPAPE